MSATPFRTDKLKLSFQKVVRDSGIHRLIADGWLAQFWHHTVERYDPKALAKVYMNFQERWGKTVVFFHTIQQCEKFAKAVKGSRVEIVSGKMSPSAVDGALDAFRCGDIDVLLSAAKLTEGFDEPTIQTVFICDSSKLPCIQRGGRGLRIAEGKRHCNIVQSRHSRWQFTRTASPERSFVLRGRKWLSLGPSTIVEETALANVGFLSAADTQPLPNFLLGRKDKIDMFNVEGNMQP